MKFSTTTADLLARLQATTRIASTRAALQALSGVMVSAHDGLCELMATDLEVGLRVSTEATVVSAGAALLPARLLLDVVRALPDKRLQLDLDEKKGEVRVTSGNATFRLRTLRAEDFPAVPDAAAEEAITLPANVFVKTAATVVRSASRDETRPVLTGVLVSAAGEELVMVATDSYRLSVKRAGLERKVDRALEANVPARALQELARLASNGDQTELSVSLTENQAIFEVAGATLSSRLIEGQFPNYRQLLPDSVEHELRLSTAELADVVRRISLLAQKNAPLRLRFTEGELTLSAQTPDVGEASETLPVPFKGEAFEIGFNPDFLRDGLEGVGADEVVLKLISPVRPGLIEAPDGASFVYLIMPIRLT